MQTEIGGVERSTSAPPVTLTPAQSSSALYSNPSEPNLPFPGTTPVTPQAVSSTKTKALQLGGSKSHPTPSVLDDLAAEWAEEEGTTNAWDGDLMDVNADADDWSEFSTLIMLFFLSF